MLALTDLKKEAGSGCFRVVGVGLASVYYVRQLSVGFWGKLVGFRAMLYGFRAAGG